MKKALELYVLDAWKYPLPSSSVNITYSWWLAWKQWTFWNEPFTQVKTLNKIPTDPLIEREYTYSVTSNQKEYEIAWVYESTILSKNEWLLNQWYAASKITWFAKITWKYNGLTLSVQSWSTTYILAVPTIINWDVSLLDLQTIIANKKLAYNWYKNLPSSYSGSKFNTDNTSFNFTPTPLLIYSWSLDTLKTSEPTRVQFLKEIQTAYSWTILASDSNISWILNVPTNANAPSAQTLYLASNILINSLGISGNNINNNAPIWSCLRG